MLTDAPTIRHPREWRLLRASQSSPVSHWPGKEEEPERGGQKGGEGVTETGGRKSTVPEREA